MKLFVKNLTHVDFSYFDAERGLLGESWQTDVLLEGKLNDESMVCDFSIVKKQVKAWLDTWLDHTLAVPGTHQGTRIQELENDRRQFDFEFANGKRFSCAAPTSAIAVLPMSEITPEAAARWCEAQIKSVIPADLAEIRITFTVEEIAGAQYQYSHGLKKHDGNCQRIAHGHRSCIEIFRNGQRAEDLEADWANRWQDIYLGTEEDLVGVISEGDHHYHHFSYVSRQGRFELVVDSKQVYLLDCDTTVESLSAHIATVLASESPGDTIEVRAYEGIGKGAISTERVNP